jgi:4-aminobutyrate aminotransferase / (S)-3-amino-2-methylpropionate transaminase / 5-aminovalerate transaminase
LQEQYPQIGDVRGLGAMVAMELVNDPQTKEPAPELTGKLVDAARKHGLLLLKAGLYSNVIRVLVPLVATDTDISEAMNALKASFTDVIG